MVTSADDFLARFGSHGIAERSRLSTVDVVNLYPSVRRPHLFPILSRRIRGHWPNDVAFTTLLFSLIALAFRAIHVTFEGVVYDNEDGIPTGMAPAALIANVYLADFDNYCIPRLGLYNHLYARVVGDVLLYDQREDVVSVMNSWHPPIQFECTAAGSRVAHLDLEVGITPERDLTWTLCRKERNLHLSVPACSAHHDSVKRGMLLGESRRIRSRCKDTKDYAVHLRFFIDRLRERGYQVEFINEALYRHRRRKEGKHVFAKSPLQQSD